MEGFYSSAARFDDWVDEERASLRRRLWKAAGAAATAEEARGDLASALDFAEKAAELRPLHEATARTLMRLYSATGDRSSALEVFERLTEALQDHFSVEPDPETTLVAASIRRGTGRPREEARHEVAAQVSGDDGTTQVPRDAGTTQIPDDGGTREPASTARRVPAVRTPGGPRIRLHLLPMVLATAVVTGVIWQVGAGGTQAPLLVDHIAVTTPRYLGSQPDGSHLARGVHDELIAGLGPLGLPLVPPGVIRKAEADSLQGADLSRRVGARYELESSIQEDGNGYRIVVVLTDWRVQAVLWSSPIAISTSSLLDMRREVAEQVANTFALEPAPIRLDYVGASQEVMGTYVQALGLIGLGGPDRQRIPRWHDAEDKLLAVVDAEPGFAAAWATLAFLRFRMFWLGADASAAGIRAGEAALGRAVELDPDGWETRFASASHAYHIERDFRRAADEAERLSQLNAASTDAAMLWIAGVRRAGDLTLAAELSERRLTAHPSEYGAVGGELIDIYRRLGRTADVQRIRHEIDRRGFSNCHWVYGDIWNGIGAGPELDAQAKACFIAGPHNPVMFWHELRMRRPGAALDMVDSISAMRERAGEDPEWTNQQWAPFPLDFWRGRAYTVAGDTARAREAFRRHVPELTRLAEELPGDFLRLRMLVSALSGSNQREAAIRELERMRRVVEEDGDRWSGEVELSRTEVALWLDLGETERALQVLLDMQRRGPVRGVSSIGMIRTDPLYDPLRSHPRWHEVVDATLRPGTPEG